MATSSRSVSEIPPDSLEYKNPYTDQLQSAKSGERVPLFNRQKTVYRTRMCIQSKAVILILLWNLLVSFAFQGILDPYFYIALLHNTSISRVTSTALLSSIAFSASAFLLLFYPLAGCLADVKLGRYKATTNSLCAIFWSLLFATIIFAIVIFLNVFIIQLELFMIIIAPVVVPLLLVSVLSSGVFSANVIQLGTDQLHDAPSEDFDIYINWYVWTTYLGITLFKVPWDIMFNSYKNCVSYFDDILWSLLVVSFIIIIGVFILGVSLCFAQCKRHWFLIDSGSRNPYKLVYKIVKFAVEHKNPIERSAFTYCEDELPSRFDLGKAKYGGPFTTEQVENVKVLSGILVILLTLGPIHAVDIAANGILPVFAQHMDHNCGSVMSKFGTMAPMALVIFVPLYIITRRSTLSKYIPGMLKRMGMGSILVTLSLVFPLIIETVGHTRTHHDLTNSTNLTCFLADRYDYNLSLIHI